MDYQTMYAQKLRTADEAVRIVKDGDWVDYSETCSFPQALDAALARRSGELHDVKIRNAISMVPVQTVENDTHGAFTYNLWHCSGLDRKYIDQGRAYRAFAVRSLLALASPAYFAKAGENGNFLLMHGVGNKPGGSEVDVPLNYGDYYFLEALIRFWRIVGNEG